MRKTNLSALCATVAAIAVTAFASAASAAAPIVTLTSLGDPLGLAADEILVADFNDAGAPDAVLAAGFNLVLTGATVGVNEGGSGYSGTLPNDATHYLTIPGQATAELFSVAALKSFSLYMGSPDTYNSIRFVGANYDYTVSGGQLSEGYVGQSWDWGQRVNFDFGGHEVNHIILTSGSNSFEVDNFAVAPVPEPATWALMIMGFGTAGAMLRRRRTASTFA
jgi:hypothetical protein